MPPSLGHSSVAFTLDTYSHVIPTLQQAAMKRLDEMLLPELAQSRDISKMFATETETDSASEEIRTLDRQFTNTWLVKSPRFEAKTTLS